VERLVTCGGVFLGKLAQQAKTCSKLEEKRTFADFGQVFAAGQYIS